MHSRKLGALAALAASALALGVAACGDDGGGGSSGGGDQAKSADIAKSIISANKDLKGFYGANEGSAIGIIKGVQESGAKGITIVGFDSGKAQIDAIKSGVMAGAITQNPVGMGKELVKSAMKAIKGEQLPKVIDTGFYWYDKTNIDDPKIQAVLYQ